MVNACLKKNMKASRPSGCESGRSKVHLTIKVVNRVFAMKEFRGQFLRGISVEKLTNFVPI